MRELVTGKYINSKEYQLVDEDGNIFQTIKEGEAFTIGNQSWSWLPEKVSKKNGKGTILVCRKYNDDDQNFNEFYLPHGKKGLWALDDYSARKGVFHRYKGDFQKLIKKHFLTSVRKEDPNKEFLFRTPFYDGEIIYEFFTNGYSSISLVKSDDKLKSYEITLSVSNATWLVVEVSQWRLAINSQDYDVLCNSSTVLHTLLNAKEVDFSKVRGTSKLTIPASGL